MKYIEDVPEKYLETLSATYYESEACKALITELLKQDSDCFTDNFKKIKEHYKQAMKDYSAAKTDFELDWVKEKYPSATAWFVTFGDGKVEITAD